MLTIDTSNNKNLITTTGSTSFIEAAAAQTVNGVKTAQALKGMYNAGVGLVNDIEYTLSDPQKAFGLDKLHEAYDNATDAIWEHLQELLNEKQTVTLKALIAEPAVGAITLFKQTGTKGFVDYIASNLRTLGNNLLEDLGNLPEVKPVVTQINNWIALVDAVKGGIDTLKGIQDVVKTLEPVLPIVRSIANLALAWISAGTTLAADIQNLLENAQKLLYSAVVSILMVLKDVVLNMTITVPKLIVTGTSVLGYNKVYNYVETLQEESEKGNLSEEKLHWAMSMLVDTNKDFFTGLNGDLFNKSVVDTVLDKYQGVPSINLDGLTFENIANKGKELLDTLTVSFVNNVLTSVGIEPVRYGYDYVWDWDGSKKSNSNSDSSPNNIVDTTDNDYNPAKIFSPEYELKLTESTIYHLSLQLIYNSDNSNIVGEILGKVKPYFIT